MTEKGKMRLSSQEFDSLMRRTPQANTGVVNYKTIIDHFTKDFEKVNIISDQGALPLICVPMASKVENSETVQSKLIPNYLHIL